MDYQGVYLEMTYSYEYQTVCVICGELYSNHNYHDDVRCLRVLKDVGKRLREQRDVY